LPGTPFDIEFSTGADSIPFTIPEGATGSVVTDKVAIGHLTSPNQTFLLADSYAQALDDMPIDGIIGMSPPNVSSIGTPFFWYLVDSGQIDSPIFSFYIPPFPSKGAEITLGGIDESKLKGAIDYVSLNADLSALAGSWIMDQSAIYAGGKLLGNSSDGATPLPASYSFLDTGTAFMQTPDFGTAKELYAQISPLIYQIDPAGAWGAPCAVLDAVATPLTFTLGTADTAANFTIPASNFNIGQYPGQPGICQAVFNNPLDPFFAPDGSPIWIIGSPLLKYYYTVWDGINLVIGWGKISASP
jgi:cathepsin D